MENIAFKHSGRLGDIVYALPLVKVMVEKKQCKANIYLLNDDFYNSKKSAYHPGEGVTINQSLFDYIQPLLSRMVYVNKVVYCSSTDAPADCIDLDNFKKQKFNLMASGTQVWYRKSFSIPVPFEEKWLVFDRDKELPKTRKHKIIIGKSTRFYNKGINYGFLDEIDNVGFVGLELEYEDFIRRNNLKRLELVSTNSALDLAHLISNADLYLGNQSLGFAIAEGLKVPRAVEVYEPVPNVIPIGGVCIEYVRTNQLIQFLTEYFHININGTYKDLDGGFVECVLTEKPLKFSKRIRKLWTELRAS